MGDVRQQRTRASLAVAIGLWLTAIAPAWSASPAAVRETAEYVVRQFAREAGEESAESLARRLTVLAERHGDDVLTAARKAGPRAMALMEQAGDDAPRVASLLARHGDEAAWLLWQEQPMRLFLKHGDDAAEAMLRHKGIAEGLIGAYDKPAIEALRGLSPQNGRRLAMMADDGSLAAGGRPADLLGVIGRTGDRGMDFVWRNKGALATAAVLTAFVADPQPFIDGTRDLAELAVDAVTQPMAQVGGQLARDIGARTDWTWVLIVAIVVAAALLIARRLIRRRK